MSDDRLMPSIPERAQRLNRAGAAAIPPPATEVPPPPPVPRPLFDIVVSDSLPPCRVIIGDFSEFARAAAEQRPVNLKAFVAIDLSGKREA